MTVIRTFLTRTRFMVVAALVATAGLHALPAPAAAETTLRALTFAPPDRNDLSMVIFREYIDRVNERGEGVVQIEILGGPEAVPLRDQMDAVSRGTADWVMTFTVHAARVPEVDTLGLSRRTVKEERDIGYIDYLDQAHERINIKVIGRTATDGGFHIFSKTPIEELSDFEGLKIRSHSGYDAFFEALGAEPIHMQISEIYEGLSRGLVQAAPYPLFVSNLGLHEVAGYAMSDAFWPSHTTASYMNRDTWDSLSPDAQEIIMDTQLEIEGEMEAMADELKAEERQRLEDNGIEFTSLPDDQVEKFLVMANDSRWNSVKDKVSDKAFQTLTDMIRK